MALDLSGLDAPPPQPGGVPLRLPLDAIEEDPAQPRREFDTASLQELAQTIAERGVRQPVSVRPHPDQPGRWVLNFGARRLRASRLAGRTEIPAFVDETADGYDQVIENEQREGLKPLELALFIRRRLAAGETQAQIARRMGKSRQYVTTAMALIDAPGWLLDAYREGRCSGLNELHELRKLAADHPREVEAWAAECSAITRDKLAGLRAGLRAGLSKRTRDDVRSAAASMPDEPSSTASPATVAGLPQPPAPGAAPAVRPTPVLRARLGGSVVCVDGMTAPPEAGHVYVLLAGTAAPVSVDASRLRLIGFTAE